MLDQRRTALLGASRPAVPLIDIGELTSTRSRPSDGSVSTSALVGEWTPPSTYAVPAIETGFDRRYLHPRFSEGQECGRGGEFELGHFLPVES